MNINIEELYAYVEDELDPDARKRVEQAVSANPELAEELAAMEASRLPYKVAFNRQKMPLVPEEISEKLSSWVAVAEAAPCELSVDSRAGKNKTHIALALACVILMTFGLGFWSASVSQTTLVQMQEREVQYQQEWVELVADYQSLYVRDTVVSISGGQDKAQILLEKIDKNKGLNSRVPVLATLGYEFKRAQELGHQGQPLVQLVYLKDKGPPLALCFMPSLGEDTPALFGRHGGLGTVSWRQDDQLFVIVAAERASALQQLQQLASKAWKS